MNADKRAKSGVISAVRGIWRSRQDRFWLDGWKSGNFGNFLIRDHLRESAVSNSGSVSSVKISGKS